MGGDGGMGGDGMGGDGMGGGPHCPAVQDLHPYDMCDNFLNGPTLENGLCCYETGICEFCGRPFVVDGEIQLAPVVARDDWSEKTPLVADIDATTRRALAAAWAEDARMEHASIASFARFSLHLLALGAPAELCVSTQQAALDEIEHARLCFGLASRYAGAPRGPGALPIDGALGTISLQEAAAAAVVEGCIGETVAALVAAEQLATVKDESARVALERIVGDEAAHAELAWQFVAWALKKGGEDIGAAVRGAFGRALRVSSEAVAPLGPGIDRETWQAHGRLLPEVAAEVRRKAIREVVAPAAEALSYWGSIQASPRACRAAGATHPETFEVASEGHSLVTSWA